MAIRLAVALSQDKGAKRIEPAREFRLFICC
jgi:hypothetical protein